MSLKTDVQLGATEQLFNLMAGRRLQEAFGQKPQVCLTYPVLVGTDGVRRMSKSTGNYIGVAEPPEQIYGKVMSIPDTLIMQYFELLTDTSEEELAAIGKQLDDGMNPMTLKKRLAREIVTDLSSEKEATEAEKHFEKVVQNKEMPKDIPEIDIEEIRTAFKDLSPQQMENTPIYLPRLLVITRLARSMSEANRLISQGAVNIDHEKILENSAHIRIGSIIKAGKRRFIKIVKHRPS